MKRISVIIVLLGAAFFCSCDKINPTPSPEEGTYSQVLIMGGLGFNNLSADIKKNFADAVGTIDKSYVPMSGSRKAVLIFEHLTTGDANYGTLTSPHIINVYKDFLGRPVCDTILTMDPGTKLTEKEIMKKGLEYIVGEFPSDHYGLLLSSHGTGWLPEGYYRSGEISSDSSISPTSFGEEIEQSGSTKTYHEMEITELRDAIPMHLDYLIFDACLMGGVEVAYELKDKADAIAMSVTEVLSTGFDYESIVSRLVGGDTPDPEGVCRDYYERYKTSSATITFLKTGHLDELASVCNKLFSKYRTSMSRLKISQVQQYYRYSSRPYFFDLLDILDKSGITAQEREEVTSALDSCITYKAATDEFLGIKIEDFCGLSMYLPKAGNETLNNFYKNYAWNKATGLVE